MTTYDADQRRVIFVGQHRSRAVIRRLASSPRRSCRSEGPSPRRAGRSPRWLATSAAVARPGWTGWGISSTSPRATTRQPGGRARRRTHRLCSGLPPGCRAIGLAPGRRDAPQPQRARSRIPRLLRNLVGVDRFRAPNQESDVWRPAGRRSESATEELPDLHQLVHQRLRTTMDALGREPEDEARPRTLCRQWRGAACDYGTDGHQPRPSPNQYVPRCAGGLLS
jgi:hypothetical protein